MLFNSSTASSVLNQSSTADKLANRMQRLISTSESSEEWKSSTKRETFSLLNQELDRLLKTAPANKAEDWKKEFANFKSLFIRFLRARTVIDWKCVLYKKN
ncbi:unnamed protein product [Meloidogyne enterolobii]|uniref:Uncharacterized protein n=1 Tax=Meloidogyne enterolobii TaxID=390850 RepID=A0ACB1AXT3_MELEN